eukprot:1035845-Prorocentrum_lima.AAC.1
MTGLRRGSPRAEPMSRRKTDTPKAKMTFRLDRFRPNRLTTVLTLDTPPVSGGQGRAPPR